MKPTQMSMFTTEDLPLFSGTAPTTHAPVFAPAAEAKQETFAKCRFCMDAGIILSPNDFGRFCWCQAGLDAWRQAHPDAICRTNPCAYPCEYYGDQGTTYWRVWRPDRTPHLHGRYTTYAKAYHIATKINDALGIPEEVRL